MKYPSTLPLLLALSSTLLTSYSQNTSALLEPYDEDPTIVIASGLSEELSDTLHSVDLLPAAEIKRSQISRLQDLANRTPGVISTSTSGQDGQIGTLIIRGLPTKYNQLILDGVKVSSSNFLATYGNLYGNLSLAGYQRLEVVKGGQSVSHGSGAVGGVLGAYTELGTGQPELQLTAEAGSFQSYQGTIALKGAEEGLSYGISLNDQFTANDVPDGGLLESRSSQFSTALQYELSEALALKLVLRGGISRLENSFGLTHNTHQLISPQLHYNTASFRSSVLLGFYQEDLDLSSYFTNFNKRTLTIDNELQLGETSSVKGGIDFEWNKYQAINTFPGFESRSQMEWQSYGVYLTGQTELGAVQLESGVRLENQTIYDALPSFHAALSHLIEPSRTTLFARVSSAYIAPSFLETEAFPEGFTPQISNRDLEVERFRGIELGLRQGFGAHVLGLTGYYQSIDQAITRVTLSSGVRQFQNQPGRSEIMGLEGSLEGSFGPSIHYALVVNHSIRNEKLDLPQNTINADLYYENELVTLGLGCQHQSQASFGSDQRTDDRTVLRLYAAYRPQEHIECTVRFENLLDEQYELYDSRFGTQYGRGFGAFGGVRITF